MTSEQRAMFEDMIAHWPKYASHAEPDVLLEELLHEHDKLAAALGRARGEPEEPAHE